MQLKCASFARLVEVARVNKVRRNSDQPVYVCTRTDTAGNLPQQTCFLVYSGLKDAKKYLE